MSKISWSAVRRDSREPGRQRPLVLPPGSGRGCSRPFDFLQKPAWPLPSERRASASLRGRAAPMHERTPGSAAKQSCADTYLR